MDSGGGLHEREIPMHHMPSSFNAHVIHESSSSKLDHMIRNNSINGPGQIEEQQQQQTKAKKIVRYRECQKNHAAAMGGNATDGCGEFMPSGEEGSLEALKCSACDCHRNFHRREVEGEPNSSCSCDCVFRNMSRKRSGVLISPREAAAAAAAAAAAQDPFAFPSSNVNAVLSARPPPQMIMSFSTGPSESDEGQAEGGTLLSRPAILKKRFRTKFSQEQKDKMLDFADKVGWRIQKHDELVVQQFCQEIGVKRRVLKVWMHNNKHTLGKKT